MKVKLNGNDFYDVSANFGSLDSVHKTAHTGVDLAMSIGSKLNSPVDGVVTKIVDYGHNNIGKGIFIKESNGETVIMGHLSQVKAFVGEKVHEGQFVAYSGNTGHTVGNGHLHLGLKDASGHFINPKPLISGEQVGGGNMIDTAKGFMDFIHQTHDHGLFYAIYGKSFFGVLEDFISQLFHDLAMFILGNSELIFVIPAIVFMGGTWIAGRNKFSKWIIPLWICYLFSKFFYYMYK